MKQVNETVILGLLFRSSQSREALIYAETSDCQTWTFHCNGGSYETCSGNKGKLQHFTRYFT